VRIETITYEHAALHAHGFVRYLSSVGGDCCQFLHLPNGEHLFFVADVCGHGTIAHSRKLELLQVFQQEAPLVPDLGELFGRLNRHLYALGGAESCVSAFAGRYDSREAVLRYVGAGHPPPVVTTPWGRLNLDEPGYLLGMFGEATYRERRLDLPVPATLLLYTDGFEEEAQRLEGGLSAMLKAEQFPPQASESKLLDHLVSRVWPEDGSAEVQDDSLVCLVGLRPDKPLPRGMGLVMLLGEGEDLLSDLHNVLVGENCRLLHFPACFDPTELILPQPACAILAGNTTSQPLWTMLEELRAHQPELPLILLNAGRDDHEALRALELGVYRYLEAPLDPALLRRYVTKALHLELPDGAIVVERARTDWLEVNAPASFEFAERLDSYLGNLIRATRFSQDELDDLSYAFLEMVNNAIEWGCKNDLSKHFKITYTVFSDKVIFKVEDEGEGFDFKHFFATKDLDPAGEEREGKRAGGLGIYLVRQCMDELKFSLKGNVVLMTKYFDR